MHLLAVGYSWTECLSFTDNKGSLFYKKKGYVKTSSTFINIDKGMGSIPLSSGHDVWATKRQNLNKGKGHH